MAVPDETVNAKLEQLMKDLFVNWIWLGMKLDSTLPGLWTWIGEHLARPSLFNP